MKGLYTHPGFTDVTMYVHTSFYIKEKDSYSLKVQFFHKRGHSLCMPYRITLTKTKCKEFVLMY
jgi:hypothetical protein